MKRGKEDELELSEEARQIGDRIRTLCNTLFKGNNSLFARELGTSDTNIRNYMSGVKPKSDFLSLLVEKVGISAEWLLLGKGDIFETNDKSKENATSYIPKQEEVHPHRPDEMTIAPNPGVGIPLIPVEAMAGAFRGAIEIRNADLQWYIVPAFDGADFLIMIKGDSMFPKYQSGDLIACKKVSMQDIFFQWGKAYVVDTDQGVLVKNVRPGTERDHITLESVNPAYLPFQLPLEGIYNVAIVLGVIRSE